MRVRGVELNLVRCVIKISCFARSICVVRVEVNNCSMVVMMCCCMKKHSRSVYIVLQLASALAEIKKFEATVDPRDLARVKVAAVDLLTAAGVTDTTVLGLLT